MLITGAILCVVAHDAKTAPTKSPPPTEPVRAATTVSPPPTEPVRAATTVSPPPTEPIKATPTMPPPSEPVKAATTISLLSNESGTDFSSVSSVPPLPPPYQRENSSVSPDKPPQQSLDSLTLELEVQELQDRVSSLEANQKKILKNQEEIIARLEALEKRPLAQQTSTPYDTLFSESSAAESFSFVTTRRPPVNIPPPPSHPPPRFIPSQIENQTPSREMAHTAHADHSNISTGAQPRRFILGEHTTTTSRVPFQPLQHQNQQIEGDANLVSQASPAQAKPGNKPLPSSVINKLKLSTVNDVLMKHPKLRCNSKIGTLAVKLAREAIFGEDVMARCTVAGERGLPGLPTAELQQLKQVLFMQFPVAPQEFESLWKTSAAAVGQACKRLRSKTVPTPENM